jgi:TRAP-type mannitol/chloroaromatic compound transport system substrate-binding protein
MSQQKRRSMKRRDVLVGAGITAGAAFSFPKPALSQDLRKLTMVTDWPEGPGLLPSARRLARAIADGTAGRIRIEVFAAGSMVRPLETFDAVQAGVADMYHSFAGYFDRKSPAFHFYSGVPFGFTANELFAWMRFGGGQELWDALTRPFNVKSFHCCSTGTQMGGWFNQEITSLDGLKGMRYRMAGPGAEVLRQLGAIVVLLAGSEITSSLRSGAIDACEWIGPWLDTEMGLHKAAAYYYYPAWHEPGTAQTLGINMKVWESLAPADQRLIEAAAANEYQLSLAEFNANNAIALRKLHDEDVVKIRKFDDAALSAFYHISQDVLGKIGSGDELSKKIYASYMDFQRLIGGPTAISEASFLAVRSAVTA